MEKLFYTIGETAEILGEPVSLVRYWCNTCSKLLKPQRNAKGNRRFTAEEIDTLKQLHLLVKERGIKLENAEKILIADRTGLDPRVKALDSLKAIRAQLAEIRKDL